ncbi:hypothetical protein [Castellaniella sp.]|uniref:hypothetical protein n=1 Tax=Castellaniella sp. TaxID=1955812 RepID=UPI00355E3F82
MRERLDCALLALEQDHWVDTCRGTHAGGRLVLHPLQVRDRPGQPGHACAEARLADPALAHGRYDAALVHVDERSLGVWRTALAGRIGRLPAVVLVYAADLRAQAVRDLLTLGVSDFSRPPFCPEELRARIEHALRRLRPLGVAESDPVYGVQGLALRASQPASTGQPVRQAITEADLCASILERSGSELEAYAVALAMQRATSNESFRAAKGHIIARFERAYICAALGRYSGNVTMAARMAQKHRRAFWALMRKHEIDPAPYRNGT